MMRRMMRRMKKTTRVKRKRKMKKDLPRGGMTTLATVLHRVVGPGPQMSTTPPHETPRRRLRYRSVRNPSSTTRATRAAAAQAKPKYYNSEFRKRNTQQHHLGDCTVMCPHCHAYLWKDELPAGGSVLDPSFEVCCKHGKIKMPRPERPFPTLLRNLYLGRTVRSAEFLKNIRSYNAALAFTSCELKADNRLGNNARYLPVRMQGQSV